MKLCNLLYNEQRPQMKCGPGLALGVTAGSSLVGGVADNILGYNQSSHLLNRQMDFQRNENQLNRDWQTEQAEIARNFEAQQTLQQNQFTKDLASQQQIYNQQNQRMQAYYNSPAYQRRQLEAANINPQVYFGSQSSFSGSSAPAAGLPSAPAGAKGHMPAGVSGLSPVGIQPPALQIGQLAQGIAGSLKSLAEAKKLGVETDWIDDRMKAEIRKLSADSDLSQVMRLGQEITNQLENAKLPYAFQMAANEVRKAVSEIELNDQNKITRASVAKVNEALAKLHNAQKQLTDKQVQRMGLEMPYYVEVLKSTINKNVAETENIEMDTSLKNLEKLFKEATQPDQVLSAISKFEAENIVNEVSKQENFVALVKALKTSKAYSDNTYATFNTAVEELAKKFGIPLAVAFKLAFK